MPDRFPGSPGYLKHLTSLMLALLALMPARSPGEQTWQDHILTVPYPGPAADGAERIVRLDELPLKQTNPLRSRYLFSFTVDGVHSDRLLDAWRRESTETTPDPDRLYITATWAHPASDLRLQWQATRLWEQRIHSTPAP